MNRSPVRHRGPNLVGIRKVVLKQKMEQKTHDLNVNYLARCLEARILPGNEFTDPMIPSHWLCETQVHVATSRGFDESALVE